MNQETIRISETAQGYNVSRWTIYRTTCSSKGRGEEGRKLTLFSASQVYAAFITIIGCLCFSNVPTFAQATNVEANTAISPATANDSTNTSNPTSRSGNSVFTLGEVVVSGSATGPLKSQDVLTSVDILGADVVETQNVDFAWELFRQAPGVMTTNFNQGAISGEFSFRAFNGEGEINAIKLLIDGIPSNSNSGDMEFLDMVFPLDIQSIEVIRGTNDARYGLHNIAGNANVFTRLGGNYTKARLSFGSFGTVDAQTSSGFEAGNFSQNYFAAYRESDGYRDHSDLSRYTFAGKWFYSLPNSNYKIGLIARLYESEADSPGYLTFGESRSQPRQSPSFSKFDGTERKLKTISGHFEAGVTSDLFFSLKSYVNKFDQTRFVQFFSTSAQQERIANELHYGAIATLTYRPEFPWFDDFVLEGGLDFQQQENESIRYTGAQRRRQALTRNQEFDFLIYGGFVQAIIKPLHWLKLVPAVRIDSADGNLVNRGTDANPNSSVLNLNDYNAIWQPKFSAVITPIEGYSLYGNWGRTFQVGVGAGAYQNGPKLKPSINDGWELGLKLSPIQWLDGRLAYWEQTATDEVRRLFISAGDSENIGETKRRGFDAQLRARPINPLSIWASFSWQEGIITKPGPTEIGNKGNEIDHIPDYVVSGGVDYQITPNFRSSFSILAQGDYFLDRANSTRQFGDYYLLNLGLFYQVNENVGFDFQVTNLTDKYYEYVWNTPNTLHSPGDGRAFYGAVNVQWDLFGS